MTGRKACSVDVDAESGAPLLSLVLTWTGDGDRLAEAIGHLSRSLLQRIEVVAVTRRAVAYALAQEYATVRFVVTEDADRFRMRELGLLHATGDIVVFSDDLLDPDRLDVGPVEHDDAEWTAPSETHDVPAPAVGPAAPLRPLEVCR